MNTTLDRRGFNFFHANAGYIVGRKAIGAASLTRAEQYARDHDWAFSWEYDDIDGGPREWGWSDEEIAKWDKTDHTQERCILRNSDGRVLAYLGGIWDASSSYRRVVEAELAEEALSEIKRQYSAVELWEEN